MNGGGSPASVSLTNSQSDSQRPKEASRDGVSPAGQGVAETRSKPATAKTFPPARPNDAAVSSQRQTLSQPGPINTVPESLFGKMSSEGSAAGDTQPISQSVFDSIIRRKASQGGEDANQTDLDTGGDGATFRTLHEGDTGHVDLLAGFGETQAGNNSDHVEEDATSKMGESSPLHYQPNLFPESQRFLTTTPAAAKTHSDSVGLSTTTPSVSRNPLAPDVGSSGGIMALSQVFKATQAPSSPFANGNGLQPEPISDRPSPNIPIQSRPVRASLSSPFRGPSSSSPRRGFIEQPAAYVSMKESQAKRDRLVEERRTRSADNLHSGDQSDSEFEKEPSFVERLNRQRRIDEETRAQLANLTAPARPASSRRGKQVPATKSPLSRKWTDDSAVQILDDEIQELSAPVQNGGTSEEETEQEEDLDPPTCRSRQIQSSTEEDKENYNVPLVHVPDPTISAHDRLSQALDLENSPSLRRPASRHEPPMFHRHTGSQSYSTRSDEPTISSQTINVRDSQPSPGRKGNGNGERNTASNPWDRGGSIASSRYIISQSLPDPSSDVEKVTSSPVAKPPMPSSPPPKDQQARFGLQQHDHDSRNDPSSQVRHTSVSSDDSGTELPNSRSVNLGSELNYVTNAHEKTVDTAGKPAAVPESKEKSSSIPSRVEETPMHRIPGNFDYTVPETSIPETSPNGLRNGASPGAAMNPEPSDQEDDDLPPLYQPNRERIGRFHMFSDKTRTSENPLQNAKILSSPSGKQRRALTEIAADVSPRATAGHIDVDINLLTADDREFRSAVGLSPAPPRKKRRGNDSQQICASDPVLPFTPMSPRPNYRIEAQTAAASALPMEPATPVAADAIQRKRSKPSRRAETVWEVEASPQNNMTSAVASRKRRLSRFEGTRPSQLRRPADIGQPVVAHNDQSLPRSRRAESPDPIQTSTPTQDRAVETNPSTPDDVVLAPNQVLACFNGHKRAYYPATCLGTQNSTPQPRYFVKFEDSAPDEVSAASVKKLELRIGDAVKVEMPNVPKVTHIVRGFDDKLSAEELCKQDANGSVPMTDIYGYSTVLLARKQRKSLQNGGLTEPERTIKVPISRIYLDMILWNQLKDRQFSYTPRTEQSIVGPATPTDRTSILTTPNSRLSRSTSFRTGLFAGMVFAVSYVEKEDVKSRVTKLIVENGGRILKDGFNELFEFPPSIPPTTPSKSPATNPKISGVKTFRLAPHAENAGFACLIADRHSRRAKYMQALALNIPCLSGRWVEDCVRHNQILDWEMYLLPAGESMYLDGATKARVLGPNPASTARLADMVAARPKLLEGQSVLLVMGRGKAEEKRRAYIFLTYALGASRVERVLDLRAAKAALTEQQEEGGSSPAWDWIYVDDHEEAAAKAMILGTSSGSRTPRPQSSRGKKRKRSELMESISGNDLGLSEKKVRIVGNEFVCQSLILGKLFDE